VGPPHPPVHEQGHPRPNREGRNGQYEQKFDQSDSHKRFSLSPKNLRTVHCPLSLKYSIPAQKGQAGQKRTAAQHRAAVPLRTTISDGLRVALAMRSGMIFLSQNHRLSRWLE